MSMYFAICTPHVGIIAAERRWTQEDQSTYDGPTKLAGIRGGFAAAAGHASGIATLLSALQSMGSPVTPEDVRDKARATAALFGLDGADGYGTLQGSAILRTPDGLRLVTVQQPADSFEVWEGGVAVGVPFGSEDSAQAMAVQTADECMTMRRVNDMIASIACFFGAVADANSFIGRELDVGIVTTRGVVYLHGTVEQLSDADGHGPLQVMPPSYGCELHAVPVAKVSGLVRQVFAFRVRLPTSTMIADPYSYAEDNQLEMQVLTPALDNLQNVVDLEYDPPPEDYVDYIVLRPYHVTDDGQWVPGPAWHASLQPPVRMQPIVDSDDLETVDTGYFFIANQYRGMPLTSVTMGRQTSPSNIVSGLTPTRGPGDTSVVKDRVMVEGEYEGEITLPIGWQSWIWFDLVFADDYPMRVMSPPLGPNRAPAFAGTVPNVIGTTVWIHGDNVRSVRVERKSGATWQVDRDTTLPIGIDVAQQDDSGNPGLSSGTGAFLVTIYSDPISARDGNTLTDAQSVNVTAAGGSPTYSIDLMTVAAPTIGDTSGSVTYKASSSTPEIATRRRYRVNFDSWSSWTSVAGASPDPAPTTATAYSLPGLPTARTLTGEFIPPQYQVDVEVEGVLLDGVDEHDVQVRSFSYTTNADDV